jgi:hypothetical protein
MLHQLAADLQQYEAKTSRFFRSLLPGARTTEQMTRERTLTPKGSDEEDALHTEQVQDDDQTDSDLYSDDSQNLHGFESTIEGDQVVNSEDDGEAASSASSSGVFRAYTDRRMAMILNSKTGATSFGGATTDGIVQSSDGEGFSAAQQRIRSRSIDSKHQSVRGGQKGHKRSQSLGSVGGSIVAREQQRITNLENALQLTPPKATTAAPKPESPSPQHPSPPRTAANNTIVAPLSTASLHYASLDRKRLAAVLRVAKDDQSRAVRLAQSYSQLLDRLGLGQACIDDMKEFAACGALKVFLPSQQDSINEVRESISGTPASRTDHSAVVRSSQSITKDGSRLLTVQVRKLPPVPATGGPAAKKQFATNLIRYFLYVLEEVRFHSVDIHVIASPTNTSGDGGETPIAGSKPTDPVAGVDLPLRREPGITALQGQMKKTKTKKMLGSNATRRSGAIGAPEDSYTFLIDVGGCESNVLSALTVVLSEGEELLCQAYPLSIVRVVVHQGLTVSQSVSSHSDVELPPLSAPDVQKSPPTAAKKAPGLSVFTSLFKSKNVKSGSDVRPTSSPPSFASKVWLSVSFSTWKLRFLHHTVRSRTVLADRLDQIIYVDVLQSALQQNCIV